MELTSEEKKLILKVCPTIFARDCECNFCTVYNSEYLKQSSNSHSNPQYKQLDIKN